MLTARAEICCDIGTGGVGGLDCKWTVGSAACLWSSIYAPGSDQPRCLPIVDVAAISHNPRRSQKAKYPQGCAAQKGKSTDQPG